MDGLGEHLLAHTAFTEEKNIGIRLRSYFREPQRIIQFAAIPDYVIKGDPGVSTGYLFYQTFVLSNGLKNDHGSQNLIIFTHERGAAYR